MISMKTKGDFSNSYMFFENALHWWSNSSKFDKYGKKGVAALKANTPKDTGLTADSWKYEVIIHEQEKKVEIIWYNDNVVDGRNVAVLIQYGHGTKNGGYVRGIDYINPAMGEVFKKIADQVWLEVTKP